METKKLTVELLEDDYQELVKRAEAVGTTPEIYAAMLLSQRDILKFDDNLAATIGGFGNKLFELRHDFPNIAKEILQMTGNDPDGEIAAWAEEFRPKLAGNSPTHFHSIKRNIQ